MQGDDLITLTSQAMLLCMIVSLPVVLTSSLVGLAVAFLQAVTSLQDSSISHGIKLVAVGIAVAATGPWAAARLLEFASSLMRAAFQS